MAKKHRRGNVRQAKLEAYVQYAPQQAALRGLLRDAVAEFKTGTRADRGASRLIQRTARSARPTVKRDYSRSIGQVRRQDSAVERSLKHLGPSAKPFLAAMGREGGGTLGRLREDRAGTLAELEGRRSDAAAGLAAAIRQRSSEFSRTADKVHQSQLDLARQKGAFTAATLGDIEEADRKFRLEVRKQKTDTKLARAKLKQGGRKLHEDKRHHKAQEREAAKKRRDAAKNKGPGGKPRLTGPQRGQVVDGVNLARRWITRLSKSKMSSTKIRELLETGGSLMVKQNGKDVKVTIPKIGHAGPISGHDIINAAYDIHAFGRLSAPNARALRGVPGLKRFRPHGASRRSRNRSARRAGRIVGSVRL